MTGTDRKRHYQAGLALFEQGRFADATIHFERVLRSEKDELRPLRPHMRALSFLALSRALAQRPRQDDVAACERAARVDDFDPLLLANLGHIYALTGKTSRALASLDRARRLDPANGRVSALLGRFDRRRPPLFTRLSRDHPLNRSLGRLRGMLGSRRRMTSAQ
jgi:Flp pilus assembly protein TadD